MSPLLVDVTFASPLPTFAARTPTPSLGRGAGENGRPAAKLCHSCPTKCSQEEGALVIC
jgi:hypothetical protein